MKEKSGSFDPSSELVSRKMAFASRADLRTVQEVDRD